MRGLLHGSLGQAFYVEILWRAASEGVGTTLAGLGAKLFRGPTRRRGGQPEMAVPLLGTGFALNVLLGFLGAAAGSQRRGAALTAASVFVVELSVGVGAKRFDKLPVAIVAR